MSLFFQERIDNVFSLCKSCLKIVIHEGIIEFSCGEFHFRSCLRHAFLNSFGSVGPASDKSFAQNLHRRSLDKYGKGLVAEDALEVDTSLHIDIEDDDIAFRLDAFHFRPQGAVE